MSQHTELRLELTKNLKWNGLLGVWLIKHHELIGLIERAADALQALERVPMTEWQPIETAPKDGTHVLVFTDGYTKIRIGWYFNGWWRWDGDYVGCALKPPTHWMPLPTPPESKEKTL